MIEDGRHTKINDRIVKAFDKIVNDDINAIIFTDDELVTEVNWILPEKDKFSLSAFKDWKGYAVGVKDPNSTNEYNLRRYKQIGTIIKKALTRQKKELFDSLKSDDKAWQRFAWILERKFSEWNLKQKVENEIKIEKKARSAILDRLKDAEA